MTNPQPVALTMLYTLFKANLALFMITVLAFVACGVLILNKSDSSAIVWWVLSFWGLTSFSCVGLVLYWQKKFHKLQDLDPLEAVRFEKETATATSFRKLRAALQKPYNERKSDETP